MGQAGNDLLAGLDRDKLIDSLNSLYCYEIATMVWAMAVRSRLSGQVLFVLNDEMEELASESLENARALAERIGEIGGGLPADVTDFVKLSPIERVELPASTAEVGPIAVYGLEAVRLAIRTYGALASEVREHDPISHRLVIRILAKHVSREDDAESFLGG